MMLLFGIFINVQNFAADQTALQFHGWVDEFLIHDVSQDAGYMASRTALIPVFHSDYRSANRLLARKVRSCPQRFPG